MAFRQFSFIFAGNNTSRVAHVAHPLDLKYPDFISEKVYALHAAARWWYEYRNEVLLLNNV